MISRAPAIDVEIEKAMVNWFPAPSGPVLGAEGEGEQEELSVCNEHTLYYSLMKVESQCAFQSRSTFLFTVDPTIFTATWQMTAY